MHNPSGLSDTVSVDAVLSATLDRFASIYKDVVIVDDETSLEEIVYDYMKSNPSDQSISFYDCTEILNQYKTWFKIFGNVQPFYGSFSFVL